MQANNLTLSYGKKPIFSNLELKIPAGQITVFIGSNGCGKSTLLRSLARLLKPQEGAVMLNGQDIAKLSGKEIARKLAILPQGPLAPEGLTVHQLVKQGRYPYQSFLQQWTRDDEAMVKKALEATNMSDMADRSIDSLSGGQRQRAWIAMTLAQDTQTILLDEPTTFLDMAHQIEILDLLYELNEKENRTVAMVLHDVNLACRYAHHIVAVKEGKVYAEGAPDRIVDVPFIREVFAMECQVMADPIFGTPLVIPHGKGRRKE